GVAAVAALFSHESRDVNSRCQALEGDGGTAGGNCLANALAGRFSYFHLPERVTAVGRRRYDFAPQFHGGVGPSRGGGRNHSKRRKGEGDNRRERQERAATTRSS